MKTTKFIALTFALVLMLSLAACGSDSNTPSGGTPTPSPSQTPDTSQQGGNNDPTPGGADNDAVSSFLPNSALAGAVNVTTNKEVYEPGETIFVTVEFLSPELLTDGYYCFVYRAEDGHETDLGSSIGVGYENILDNVEHNDSKFPHEFQAPFFTGNFEIRLYANMDMEKHNAETLAAVVPIVVSDEPQQPDNGGTTTPDPTPDGNDGTPTINEWAGTYVNGSLAIVITSNGLTIQENGVTTNIDKWMMVIGSPLPDGMTPDNMGWGWHDDPFAAITDGMKLVLSADYKTITLTATPHDFKEYEGVYTRQ